MAKTQAQIDWYNNWRKTPEGQVKARAATKRWREANRERLLGEARNKNLLHNYGISETDWDALFVAQGNQCAICLGKECHGKNWHTDHCHTTGKVRGILCGWCNTALGKFQEDSRILESAIKYLNINQKYASN